MDLLAAARRLVATGPVCDACLGRPFADRSFGLSNAERGRALRVTLALDDDDPYDPPATCWVCEGHAADADRWAERIVEAVSAYDFETFQVGTRVPPLVEENDRLLREDAGLAPDAGESFKSDFNREVGKRVADRLDVSVDFERPDVLAVVELASETVDLQVNSAFVYGRYRKLERGIPQTEWPCRECNGSGVATVDGERRSCEHCDGAGYLYATSVEEEIAPAVTAAMEGTDATFHGAGREDVDARMLGTGRPFVLEVEDPHVRTPDLEALEARINQEADGVAVDGLRLATHDMVERVKRLEASKTYRATVAFDEPVTETALADALVTLDGATIDQYTPERVDHRRAGRTRTRTVYEAAGELESPTQATLTFHTEGGLYVKELVSGDNDRTDPSLAGLLEVGATVTALDVLAVEGEDETFEQPAFFRAHND